MEIVNQMVNTSCKIKEDFIRKKRNAATMDKKSTKQPKRKDTSP